MSSARSLFSALRFPLSDFNVAFIAQWIEQTSPKGKIGVRFPVRALQSENQRGFRFLFMNRFDERWMREALLESQGALRGGDGALDDVPIGAVVVFQNEIIGRGHNECVLRGDPTHHGEMVAMRAALQNLRSPRLEGATLYVTLEPCAMCAGALWLCRLERLVFGAFDSKAGACGSVFDIPRDIRLNHQLQVRGGVLESECAAELREFFVSKRHK